MNKQIADAFNDNLVINSLISLHKGMRKINELVQEIEETKNFKRTQEISTTYESIFKDPLLSANFVFEISRIHKALSFMPPNELNQGNAYWHLKIDYGNEVVKWLDEFYDNPLLRIIRYFKKLFSKIDNFSITHNPRDLEKYHQIFSSIDLETRKYISSSIQRESMSKRDLLDESELKKLPFGGLFHMTHEQNIPGILKYGILSHNVAHKQRLVQQDISNQQVNQRRDRVVSQLAGNIHDFAPLYFNPRNPMQYWLLKNVGIQNLVVLRINPHVLMYDDVFFTDGNASVQSTQFYRGIEHFNKLKWETISGEYWLNHPDGKRIHCSEALVRNNIPNYYITDLFVQNENQIERMMREFPNHFGIKLGVNTKLFF